LRLVSSRSISSRRWLSILWTASPKVDCVGFEHLTDLRQRHASVGEDADLDEGHDCRWAIPPVTRSIPLRLGQYSDLVIVPHRPHRDAGIAAS
jgi:hypothetical protein